MTKGNASSNIQSAMGAIRFTIFERRATTKRVVHASGTRSGLVRTRFLGVVFICTEPTVSAR